MGKADDVVDNVASELERSDLQDYSKNSLVKNRIGTYSEESRTSCELIVVGFRGQDSRGPRTGFRKGFV